MIYLDNAATTKPKFFAKEYNYYWLNSNMSYAKYEQKALEDCRENIKNCLGVNSGKVLFCRCATETIEWLCKAFTGVEGAEVDSAPSEHDSVYDVTDHNSNSFKEFFLGQYVNQLTGRIFNIEVDGKAQRVANGFFGSDFTAAIGHAKIPDNLDTYCDAVWTSSHKFSGPKNQGFIWLSDRLFKYLGGNNNPRNNYGLLHGTLDVPGICAMTEALKNTISYTQTNLAHYQFLTNYLYISAETNGVTITEHVTNGSPAIHAITVPFVNADALQAYLSSKEIYVGLGHSACSDEADYRVLEAQGYTKEQAESTIRVSFCEDNSYVDVDKLVRAIKEFKEKF